MNIVDEVKKAVEYTSKKKYKEAEKIYKEILTLEPDNAIVLSCLGLLYLNIRMFGKAKKYLLKSASISPISATLEGLGLLYYYTKNEKLAVEYFEKVIDKTNNPEVFERYIDILLDKKRLTKAMELAEKYVKFYPFSKEAQEYYGACLMSLGKFNQAYNLFNKLVKTHPKYWKAWQDLGLVYEMYFHDEEMAKLCYENIVKCGNKYVGYSNLIINASKRFALDEAFEYIRKFDRFCRSKNKDYNKLNEYNNINFSKSVVYFKHRDFMKAYKYYIKGPADKMEAKPLDKLKNFWDGKTYKGETLLLYLDQGIGDGIMFSRYIPFLAKKFKQVKAVTRGGIFEISKRSFKQYKNVKFYTYKFHMPKYDKSMIASNSPYYLKMSIDKIPYSEGYLIADKDKVDKYKEYINSDKFKVGICWEAGGAGWRELLNRTLNISLFEPFFGVKNTQFYSLQVNPTMDNYKDYKNLICLGDTFKDFDDTAGALKNLDLLITVDTSVAHLAGALGVKTFMLLPYCPDWRWFDNDKTTEWYDSVTIFKQSNTKSWDDVIENITVELDKLANHN